MSLKLIEDKVVDHEPLPPPPPSLGCVYQQVATDLCVLVSCLHLHRDGEMGPRQGEGGKGEES